MSIFEFCYTKLPLDIWFSFTDAVGGKETDLYLRTWCAFVSLCAHVDNLIVSLEYSWKGNGNVYSWFQFITEWMRCSIVLRHQHLPDI